MQAIRIHENGGPEVLRYEEIEMPEPKAKQARVKIEAIGVNFLDIYHRMGRYAVPLPFSPGSEAAGVVDAVGADVTEVKVGERVAYAMQLGSYAEYAIVDAWKLAAITDDMDMQSAAAMMLQGMTAHYLAHSTYPLGSGDTALIHAAAGGVGLLLVQIAKRLGARVIGTVSTEEKAQLATEAGADDVILYTQKDFEEEVKRLTDGAGVEVVYDSVGKTTFEKGLNCLKPRGYMVLFGQASGPAPKIDPQTLMPKGSIFVTRPGLGHHLQNRDELLGRVRDLSTWVSSGELKLRVDTTFPLAEAADAHRYMEDRKSKGKLLLIP